MNITKALVASLVASLLAGCAANTDAGQVNDESEDVGSSEAAYNFLSQGFYMTPQTGNKQLAVWHNLHCWVIDAGHKEAVRIQTGFSNQPRFVALSTLAEHRPGSAATPCSWPNGMLVRAGAVFLIENGTSCHIMNDDQVANHGGWGRVWWPTAPADQVKFDSVTRYTGDCRW